MTRQIPLDDVLPGMALGDNVQSDGHVLMRAGTLLTVSSLDALRRRGIVSVPIQVKAVVDPAHLAAEKARLEQVLQLRFRRAGNSAAAQSLRQAALEVLLEANV